jgi:guanylate kinase
MTRGELFILSAPSGAGKTTLIRRIMEGPLGREGGVEFSVSHTTRAPRGSEKDGVAYHFVDPDRFNAMIAADEFLEWAQVHGNYYGTSNAEVLPRLDAGVDVLLDIDVQGAERVLARHEEAHGIFVVPPSYEALRVRLEGRARDDADEIARRLAVSIWEIKHLELYDHVIVNDDAEQASQVLAAILLSRRHRRERMGHRLDAVLKDFEAHAGRL